MNLPDTILCCYQSAINASAAYRFALFQAKSADLAERLEAAQAAQAVARERLEYTLARAYAAERLLDVVVI